MNDEQCWQAVMARDKNADGLFVLAVRTTGIYCRPSCPARHARRENVIFFERPAQAEAAGFRPCKRCHPQTATPMSATTAWVEEACRLIEAAEGEPLTLAELSARLGRSPYHVQRTFKQVTGVTPREYAEARRVERVKMTLKQERTVTMALYEAGYGSSSRLYESVNGHLGMTPRVYRRGGAGMHIRYTIVSCALGRLMVAATERGLCFVSLADDDATLDATLRGDYHAAEIERDDAGLGAWVRLILDYLAGRQTRLDLPLDIQGTAFQRQVWAALQAIPRGSTRTYSQIAEAIGNPKAARAVGHACATNPVSLIIPCHRAVREGGGLGGYRWGLARKETLLELERGGGETGD